MTEIRILKKKKKKERKHNAHIVKTDFLKQINCKIRCIPNCIHVHYSTPFCSKNIVSWVFPLKSPQIMYLFNQKKSKVWNAGHVMH